MRVLFTCFNRPLADHLRQALADAPGVEVQGFHQRRRALADVAKISRLVSVTAWQQPSGKFSLDCEYRPTGV